MDPLMKEKTLEKKINDLNGLDSVSLYFRVISKGIYIYGN